MAPKNKNKGTGRRSKTPGQTSASNPDPTATSPSVSSPTGDATTTSLVPSSAFPSAPPTTTTTTQLIPSESPQPTSMLPSSASQITTTEPLPSAPPPPPPLPIQETHQEVISCTSEGSTTTDLPGPSTAPFESAASTRTPTFLPTTDEYLSLIAPAVACAMTALQSVKEEDPADLQEMIVGMLGLQLDDLESVLGSLLGLVEIKKGNAEMNVALEALFNMEGLRSAIKLTETMLAERKKRHGSGGSQGGGGGPDSGSGEGDGGEGGGVAA